MQAALLTIKNGSRTLSYLLGLTVLGFAAAVIIRSERPAEITHQAMEVFGPSYLVLLFGLIFATLFCWTHQRGNMDTPARQVWTEAGLHAAGGVSTLALTYTLLGISLGIGTLADQKLNPQTVQAIIGDLTRHFSMAFMTSVIGLPVAAMLQALVRVTEMQMESRLTLHNTSKRSPTS